MAETIGATTFVPNERNAPYHRKAAKATAASVTPQMPSLHPCRVLPAYTARAMKPANQKIIVTVTRARVAKMWENLLALQATSRYIRTSSVHNDCKGRSQLAIDPATVRELRISRKTHTEEEEVDGAKVEFVCDEAEAVVCGVGAIENTDS